MKIQVSTHTIALLSWPTFSSSVWQPRN